MCGLVKAELHIFYTLIMNQRPETLFSNSANLPTKYGSFNVVSFKEEGSFNEHLVLTMGDVRHKEKVLTRVHSECLTGDVFTSLKCDCGEQLEASMRLIAEKKEGIIIYLKQEGRGIGLFNKINAYALQDQGQDTIQANHSLGFETDLRTFDIVSDVIEFLEVESINLLTNNPEKIEAVLKSTRKHSTVQPLKIKPNQHNITYLDVKKRELMHVL
jgi:GTP cyclohydrolase II